MESEGVLVVAFDGMDSELVEEFGLENISQKEFGGIDNSTGVSEIMTSELFASFITGETHEVHGVEGLVEDMSLKDRFFDYFFPDIILNFVPGVYRLRNLLVADSSPDRKYSKQDLQCESIFEEMDASLPLYIPSYNPSVYWALGMPHLVTNHFDRDRFVKEARYDTETRLREGTATQPAFFDVNKDFWDFIMLHLHDPDAFQDTTIGDLEEEYNRLDQIAGEILEEYDGWTVIFMSDHGRPVHGVGPHEHNENAFYSCNKKLFGDKKPYITDFHDKILELVGDYQ